MELKRNPRIPIFTYLLGRVRSIEALDGSVIFGEEEVKFSLSRRTVEKDKSGPSYGKSKFRGRM